MVIDRITLFRIYSTLIKIENNEVRGSSNSRVHNIIMKKRNSLSNNKQPTIQNLKNLQNLIKKNYPYNIYDVNEIKCSPAESVWSLIQFEIERSDTNILIKLDSGNIESNKKGFLHNKTIQSLNHLKNDKLLNSLLLQYNCIPYIEYSYLPDTYISTYINDAYKQLFDKYYRQTRFENILDN